MYPAVVNSESVELWLRKGLTRATELVGAKIPLFSIGLLAIYLYAMKSFAIQSIGLLFIINPVDFIGEVLCQFDKIELLLTLKIDF